MNAMLIEATDENFQGETTPHPKGVESGHPVIKTWTAASFTSGDSVSTGIWACEPGCLKIKRYPVDEVFTVLTGKIEVTNEDGTVVLVEPGKSCLLRKGWSGLFNVLEPTQKVFITTAESS